MTASTPARYTLEDTGRTFAVETESAGWSTIARLFVDGVQVDDQKSREGSITLQGGGFTVVVRLNWLDQVTETLAVPQGTDPTKADEEGIAFDPQVGSRAARLERLRREHPALYAARHIVMAILQVLVGVLGIGALVRGLLPRIGLPDNPWPDLPAIPWPDLPPIPWPDLPWPEIALPDLAVPDWIGEVWSSVNWVVPLVVAVVVAINEIDKRRKRSRAAVARRHVVETGPRQS